MAYEKFLWCSDSSRQNWRTRTLWPRPTSIIEICLEYVKAKQGRELLVSEVKGIFGDVEGIVIYLPKPLQNDMPITEWHALRLEV